MNRPLVLLIPLVFLTGCEWMNETLGWGPGRPGADDDEPPRIDSGWWDTGDRTPRVESIINSINPRCEASPDGDVLTVSVVNGGSPSAVTLDIYATGDDDRLERFTFPEDARIAQCPDGACDEWEHQMRQDDAYSDEAATMTLDCDDLGTNERGHHTGAAFRIETTPSDPQFEVQCAMWGHRAREMFGADCECFEAFLANPPDDPCGDYE